MASQRTVDMGSGTPGFGDLLRRYRTAAALSQEELATRSGLSPRGISDLERGARRSPRLETVRLLADALGLTEEERVALLAAREGTPAEPPTDPTPTFDRPSLPVAPTPLVGREREVAAAVALFRDQGARLVTLTGPGGVGKTRLALAIADVVAADLADGAYLVELASVGSPDLVGSTIVQRLGASPSGGEATGTILTRVLRGRQALLVLDNFEHVLAAAALVADLLAACPELAVLVTSRVRLRVRGERELPVAPLPLPDPGRLLAVEELAKIGAVRLFVERARDAKPAFALTDANAAAVSEICRRLDGLPLALELAAARSTVLPPAALLARLEPRLPLLTGGARDAPDRHRTLRHTVSWSHELLSDEEQVLFRRLAVFAGRFTLEAAEFVGQATSPHSLPAHLPTLDLVTSLVDHSLLRQVESENEPGFLMLETIREFGLEKLAEAGEGDAVRRAHSSYYLELAEAADAASRGPEDGPWFDRLEIERPNLRAALDWLRRHGEAEVALRLAAALAGFWFWRSHYPEGRLYLEAVLTMPGAQAPTAARAKALTGACVLADRQGDLAHAEAFGTEAVAISRRLGDRVCLASALRALGSVAANLTDLDRAARLGQESLTLVRSAGDRWGETYSLGLLGVVAYARRDLVQAVKLAEQAVEAARVVGNQGLLARALGDLAHASLVRGDWRRAAVLYQEELALARQAGQQADIAWCLAGLAGVAAMCGEDELAARLFGAAEARREAVGVLLRPSVQAIYDPMLTRVRAALGEEAFVSAWAAGRALSPREAIAEAMSVAGQPAPP